MSTQPSSDTALANVRRLLTERWPHACEQTRAAARDVFRTGISGLDALLPGGGLPFGSWVEITGGTASGKTSLLLALLAQLAAGERTLYLDFPRTFYPVAATAAGVDLNRIWVARPRSLPEGVHIAEQLLTSGRATVLVFDLAEQRTHLPGALAHRLRQHVLRGDALALFLTEGDSRIIGQSMMAMRLRVRRTERSQFEVCVVRSRICCEGVCIRWASRPGVHEQGHA